MTGTNRIFTGTLVAGLLTLAIGLMSAGSAPAGPEPQQSLPVEIFASPAQEWSSQPNLSVDGAGNVYLIWSERAPQTPAAIKFSRFDGRGWSPARTIVTGRGLVASAADIPSVIALPSGRLAAHWLQVGVENSRGYGVRVSQSVDGGTTWAEPVIPHTGHETGENGFVSLYAAGGDSVGVVWLDGRNFARGAAAVTEAVRNQTMLLNTRISAGGGLSPHSVLDNRACECCHTSFATTSRGPVVVYRDRTAEEIRDISLVQLAGGNWTAPRTVHGDSWYSRSCPVNGPSVAAWGSEVAVAWFTAARDSAKVLLSFSSNNATSFSTPVRVDAGEPIGRVGAVMLDARTAWVSWLERSSQYNSQLRLRRINAGGATSAAYVLAAPNLTHATGFPRMVQRRGEIFLAWSTAAGTGAPPSIRVARVSVAGR